MKGEVFLAFFMSKFLVHFTEGMLGVGVRCPHFVGQG